jgi:hypothetical protein
MCYRTHAGRRDTVEIECPERIDWNTVGRAIAHWRGDDRFRGPKLRLESVYSIRNMFEQFEKWWPKLCRIPLIRLNDLIDEELAFSMTYTNNEKMTDIVSGFRMTGCWYESVGWL